jgi:hypothetical protein
MRGTESCHAAWDAGPASSLPHSVGGAIAMAQPIPSAAARIVSSGGRGIARDRLWLLTMYRERYRRAMATVAASMPHGSRGVRGDRISVLADLAAVHLYLNGEWTWIDNAMLAGRGGPHVPFARCVTSGLRRLPPYRGPAVTRIDTVERVTDWYRCRPLVVDQGFWSASSASAALSMGGPGFLVWSLTGRRTGLVDPTDPERVVFAPGTRFKVLHVTQGEQPVIFLREMFPSESATPCLACTESDQTEWLDKDTLEELTRATGEPPGGSTVRVAGPPGRCPGLIVTASATGLVGELS